MSLTNKNIILDPGKAYRDKRTNRVIDSFTMNSLIAAHVYLSKETHPKDDDFDIHGLLDTVLKQLNVKSIEEALDILK